MNNTNPGQQASPGIFAEAIHRFLPFWPLFLVCVALTMTAGYIYLYFTPPIYSVHARVLMSDERNGMEAKILEALEASPENGNMENEIGVLKSWTLMQTVVEDLHLYTAVFLKGKARNLRLYGPEAPVSFRCLQPGKIEKAATIPFAIDFYKRQLIMQGRQYRDGAILEQDGQYYQVKLNPAIKDGHWENLELQIKPVVNLAEGLSGAIRADMASKQSTILNLSMETLCPAEGADVLNRLYQNYRDSNLAFKNLSAVNTLRFVDDRLRLVVSELDSIERNISDYKKREGIYEVGVHASQLLGAGMTNDQKRAQIQVQLDALAEMEQYVRSKGANPNTVPSVVSITDPMLVQLVGKLNELELEYLRVQQVTGEKSDAQVQLRESIAKIKPAILENIKNIRANLLIAKRDADSMQASLEGRLNQIPAKERVLVEISRQQAIKNNLYSFLLEKRESAAISAAAAVSGSRMLEGARANVGPIKPVRSVILTTAFALGITIGVLLVMLKEQFNDKLLFRKELEENSTAPVVGELDFMPGLIGPVVIVKGNRSVLAEQFRHIRTNLGFMGASRQKGFAILITSSVSGEGKSFMAVNLAVSYTLLGKKVLLIDADLRSPKIRRNLGLEGKLGTSEYLAGAASFEAIVQEVPDYPGLSVITSGAIPPNPAELIAHDAFANILVACRSEFDVIIIDSAPVGLVSDAMLIGPRVDTTLYLSRHNYTPKVYLGLMERYYQEEKFPNLALVFNGIKQRGLGTRKYGFGYGYGLGYGHGYGYGQNPGKGNGYVEPIVMPSLSRRLLKYLLPNFRK